MIPAYSESDFLYDSSFVLYDLSFSYDPSFLMILRERTQRVVYLEQSVSKSLCKRCQSTRRGRVQSDAAAIDIMEIVDDAGSPGPAESPESCLNQTQAFNARCGNALGRSWKNLKAWI